MLKKQDRIRLEKEYKSILSSGSKFYSQFFLLVVKKTSPEKKTRFGFIASKKVGNAVVRNSVKRKLREIVRLSLNEIKPGFDCVIIANPNTPNASYKELEKAFEKLIVKSNLKV